MSDKRCETCGGFKDADSSCACPEKEASSFAAPHCSTAWWNDYKAYAYFLLFVGIVAFCVGQHLAAPGWIIAAIMALKLSRWQRMP